MNDYTARAIWNLSQQANGIPPTDEDWTLLSHGELDYWAKFAQLLRDEFRAGSSPVSRGA